MKVVVRVDPTRCRGHGICALLFAEGIELDHWGYGRPLRDAPEGRRAMARAGRAAKACPNGAVSFSLLEEPAEEGATLV